MHYLLKTQALYNPTKGTIGPALVEIRDQQIAAVYETDNQEVMGDQANLAALVPEALKHLPLEDLGNSRTSSPGATYTSGLALRHWLVC